MEQQPSVVAVVNSSPDTVEILRATLAQAGMTVVCAYTHEIRDGKIDVQNFASEHQPQVVVYDLAPPYDQNWRLFQDVRHTTALNRCRFIITSTNPERAYEIAGRDEHIYEIVGKPYDLLEIAQAVKGALRARPAL